jgi:hypothetical protein
MHPSVLAPGLRGGVHKVGELAENLAAAAARPALPETRSLAYVFVR